jgi:trimethylamine--corrinoid protein Co-methyltransferase
VSLKRNLYAGKRQSGGLRLNVFTDDELDQIHAATLEVLWKTGIFVEDEEALEVFDAGGATVDLKTKIVKIPPYVLEDAVSSAPEIVILAGRNSNNDMVLERSRVGFTNFGEAIKVIDAHTGELREPTKADVGDCAVLIDYLEHVDVCERPMGAHEVPQAVAALHNAEAMLSNTTKHCFLGPQNGYLAKKVGEMVAAVVGGTDKLRDRSVLTFLTCPVSPLKLVRDCCEIIMEAARSGMGVGVLSQALAGGTSTITRAGTLVTHNAEVLSGLVLSQLTRKGSPFIYCSSTCSLDLRYGTAVVGNPETGLLSAAIAQMARYYLLPSWVAGG